MGIDVEAPFVLSKPLRGEADFYGLVDEDSPWELLDGRLVMRPASDRHEDLFRFLLTLLSAWLDERGGGVVRGSRYPMRFDPRWSPEPDLLVVTDAHRERITAQRLEGPADLVVEIASDGDPDLDERDKLPRYRAAGIPEIWLVSPQTTSVRVDRLDPQGQYVTERRSQGRLDSTVLPGLWIEVAWLWEEPLPSTLGCLRGVLS
ncbi:MAG: Uma2 family endonuclease [Actinomycetota bacterium]|nr:Uma2 family endonuclease [Actinomycetota bacterium]